MQSGDWSRASSGSYHSLVGINCLDQGHNVFVCVRAQKQLRIATANEYIYFVKWTVKLIYHLSILFYQDQHQEEQEETSVQKVTEENIRQW